MVKESTCQCRRRKRLEFNPWVRKITGGEIGNPFQYSYLENPWTEESDGLQSMGLQRVANSWAQTDRIQYVLHFISVLINSYVCC